MNIHLQTQAVEWLIAHDENEITEISTQIDRELSLVTRTTVLSDARILLEQGLAGLHLKHDSLVDRQAIVAAGTPPQVLLPILILKS